ncbi:MAG: polysaccharide biosynthesis protein [Clostridiales bacterium]|nr:polysaccharide biosynthesis protein [Clostridiales bacterium]
MSRDQKQNTFFGGAAILAVGILVVKLIGMFYKIPLVNIIGAQGNSDFSNAYNIYAVLLTISTAGLPVAVSKLVSEANALNRQNQVRSIFRTSMVLFLALGLLSFLLMYFRADWLAEMMHDTKAAAGIKALAPAVVCVGCLAAFRGYTQGHQDMVPTSVSQIIEAMCKLVVGLALAWWLIKAGQPDYIAAAGAITGVTVGTVVALAYMLIRYTLRRSREQRRADDRPDSMGGIMADILRIAVPITLSASMVGIVTVIDSSLVQGQLQRALLEKPACWELYRDFIDFAPLQAALDSWKAALPEGQGATIALLTQQAEQGAAGAQQLRELLESVSRTLYGNYSGALNIYNLPTSLMAAITASVIPAVSGALARRDRRGAGKITGSALRITALLAFPMGVGLFVMGTPIMQLLYPALSAQLAGPLLSTLGLATVFVCMMLVCNSVLQAHGFVNLPVLVMLLGGGLKIVTNYHVVVQPGIGIYGAPMGNILCFGLCLALDLVVIARVIPKRPAYLPIFVKPLLASLVMGGAAWAVNGLLTRLLSHGGELSRMGCALTVFLSIGVAMVVYMVLVVALRIISRDDLALMPKGDKIARLLRL